MFRRQAAVLSLHRSSLTRCADAIIPRKMWRSNTASTKCIPSIRFIDGRDSSFAYSYTQRVFADGSNLRRNGGRWSVQEFHVARRTVDAQALACVDALGGVGDADHCGDAVFARDHGAVRQ
jgi:hypothetical protein